MHLMERFPTKTVLSSAAPIAEGDGSGRGEDGGHATTKGGKLQPTDVGGFLQRNTKKQALKKQWLEYAFIEPYWAT